MKSKRERERERERERDNMSIAQAARSHRCRNQLLGSCIVVQYDILLLRIEEKLLHYYMSSSVIYYISHVNTLFQDLGPVQCFHDRAQLQTQKLVKQSYVNPRLKVL